MRTLSRTLLLSSGLALVGLLGVAPGSAQAQNTYADFPFNQGSLFYRPSGIKSPRTTMRAPAYQQAAPRYDYPTTATAPVYQAPAAGTYYYPTQQMQTYQVRRRGLFRR